MPAADGIRRSLTIRWRHGRPAARLLESPPTRQSHNKPSPAGMGTGMQPILIDVYEGPHPKHLEVPSCDEHLGIGFRQSEACHALLAGYEGWTQLNFMVDHD